MFRENQIKDLLAEPKEVQTDDGPLEDYLWILEDQREEGMRAMQVARRLTAIDMLHFKAQAALEK